MVSEVLLILVALLFDDVLYAIVKKHSRNHWLLHQETTYSIHCKVLAKMVLGVNLRYEHRILAVVLK